jgi:hypothetical protein
MFIQIKKSIKGVHNMETICYDKKVLNYFIRFQHKRLLADCRKTLQTSKEFEQEMGYLWFSSISFRWPQINWKLFKKALETLKTNMRGEQYLQILFVSIDKTEVSHGGLAGKSRCSNSLLLGCWFAYHTSDDSFVLQYKRKWNRNSIKFIGAWEFNNKHLMYITFIWKAVGI